jgi:hypothetical protein
MGIGEAVAGECPANALKGAGSRTVNNKAHSKQNQAQEWYKTSIPVQNVRN